MNGAEIDALYERCRLDPYCQCEPHEPPSEGPWDAFLAAMVIVTLVGFACWLFG